MKRCGYISSKIIMTADDWSGRNSEIRPIFPQAIHMYVLHESGQVF